MAETSICPNCGYLRYSTVFEMKEISGTEFEIGQLLVVRAISEGRQAAAAIDRYLKAEK